MIYKRTILKEVIEITKDYPITLITGARQVGKTELVQHFYEKCGYDYVTFEDKKLIPEAKKSPRDFLKKYKFPLIIDEIQEVQELFSELVYQVGLVKRNGRDANGMFILTGSQKYELMKHATESMAGRVGIIEMPPLTQAEIRGWDTETFTVNNDLLFKRSSDRYLTDEELYGSILMGFYPEQWKRQKKIRNFYRNYVKSYLERDVSSLINIKDKIKFENFLKYLASWTAQECVAENIGKVIGIDGKTVKSWLSILVAGDIIRIIQPYYESSIKKEIVKRGKIYFNDTGLVCHLLEIDNIQILKNSKYKGAIIETYIHNEIWKSYINNGVEPRIHFYRDNHQVEIDLVALNKDGKLDLVECKSGSNYGFNDIKAFKCLETSVYEINGKCIICMCAEPEHINGSIKAFPIWCV